eukprot:6206148-Pleurochrysis_carterae.AAC.2
MRPSEAGQKQQVPGLSPACVSSFMSTQMRCSETGGGEKRPGREQVAKGFREQETKRRREQETVRLREQETKRLREQETTRLGGGWAEQIEIESEGAKVAIGSAKQSRRKNEGEVKKENREVLSKGRRGTGEGAGGVQGREREWE